MKPIGLAFKNIRINPYTGRSCGELMVIHQCLNCGKISCNRIAGDDNSYAVVDISEGLINLSDEIIVRLNRQGITPLTREDKPEILIALYGYGYKTAPK